MKAQHLRPSPRPSPASVHPNQVGSDWKRRFRLSALDLNPQWQNTTTEAQHWVCGEPQLMRLLQLASDELTSLNTLLGATGEPVLPREPAEVLHMLGVGSVRKPDTLPSKLRFCLQLLTGLARLVNLTSSARLALSITQPAQR